MSKKICTPRIFVPPFVMCDLLLAAVVLLSTSGLAQTNPHNTESPAAARMRGLNNSLLQLHGQMQHAAPHQMTGLRGQAATVVAQRAAALTTLIQNNPQAALSFAFSPGLLADLSSKFPQSSSLLESHATVTGQVQHWIVDYPKSSRSWWRMNAGGRNLNLFFAGQEPANLKNGQLLQATGVVVGSQMAVETSAPVQSSAVSRTGTKFTQLAKDSAYGQQWRVFLPLICGLVLGVPGLPWGARIARRRIFSFFRHFAIYGLVFAFAFTSAPGYAQNACTTTGVQQVAVLVVTFPGISVPSFSPSLKDLFFGPAPSLTSYWNEASYGTTSAAGNVFGPFTLNGTYSCSNILQFVEDSVAAAADAGVDFNTYKRVNIIYPGMSPSCGFEALTSIGCQNLSTSAGTFTVSTSATVWNYIVQNPTGVGIEIIIHENGHELGLAHAQLRTDGTTNLSNDTGSIPLGPIGETCSYPAGSSGTQNGCVLFEYADDFSVMGASNTNGTSMGHMAAGHKAGQLGWLTASNYQTVNISGTYTIEPYETSPAGVKALKIQRGAGQNAWLWVEYRQPIGYDAVLYPTQIFGGALIHYEESYTAPYTELLDFTAPNTYADDPALVVGQTWTDPYSNVSISVLGATSSGLTVSVNYGATPCTAAAPSVTVSPLNPSIYPGQSAGYTAAVTNNDSSGCSSSTINLGSTEPSGWSTSLSASSVTLSPGQSASVTMGKGAPAGTAAGTYAVNLNAATTSNTGSGTANATVMTPPSLAVSVSVSGTSFTRPGTVPITTTVTNGGTPASSANVTFTLTAPNGTTSTQTATTGSAGTATWNYKLNAKSPTGTYSVLAQAALSSGTKKNSTTTQTATSNTGTFTVQ